jgi:hypothetical protein
MSAHGAIDTETQAYVVPRNASRGRNYVCVDCSQRVVFRCGDVRLPHFAHFTPSIKCTYYNTTAPESDQHKHAKQLLKTWLIARKPITFGWACKAQTKFGSCNTMSSDTEHSIEYKDGDEVVLEYRDPARKYIADVAVVNSGQVRYIIEVVHSHRTITMCRPEPWFEVRANDIDEGLHYGDDEIILDDCRINSSRFCSNCRVKQERWVTSIPILSTKYGVERAWRQDMPCICCKSATYSPEWIASRPRQVCKMCLGDSPEKVRDAVNTAVWS